MTMYVTIISLNKKDKLLVKVKQDYDITPKVLTDLKKKIIKAYKGQWVIMPDSIEWEKLI